MDRTYRNLFKTQYKRKQYINLLNESNMKRIINAIKAFFRRIAVYVVTAYANHIYQKAVKVADKRHEEEKTTIYVANGTIDASELRTYNRNEFRRVKRFLKIYDNKSYNMCNFKQASWYYTPNAEGAGGMTPRTKELRRLAFVKNILRNAKLV